MNLLQPPAISVGGAIALELCPTAVVTEGSAGVV
jgi:hypothetical protein